MAMIKCPECEKAVSGSATACPHCGHPIIGDGWAPWYRLTARIRGSIALQTLVVAPLVYLLFHKITSRDDALPADRPPIGAVRQSLAAPRYDAQTNRVVNRVAEQPPAAPKIDPPTEETARPPDSLPWSKRAETEALRLLSGQSGINVAITIQEMGHPSGKLPLLGKVEVLFLDETLVVMIPVTWTGGILGGRYETVIEWRCNETKDLGIRVLKEEASTAIADDNLDHLRLYFHEQVYDVMQRNLARSR